MLRLVLNLISYNNYKIVRVYSKITVLVESMIYANYKNYKIYNKHANTIKKYGKPTT